VKWYPGHYLHVGWDAPEEQVARMLAALPAFRGVKRFHPWRDLEPDRDRYDFSKVRRQLAEVERLDTRLALYIEVQAYHDGRNYTPGYIAGDAFGGGTYRSWRGATNPVLWNRAVAERIAALYRALGAEFDAHPRLAVVVTPETSAQVVHGPHPAHVERYSEARLLDAFRIMVDGLRTGFPRTVTLQFVNYPVGIIAPLTAELARRGVGLGGPDVFLDDPGLHRGVYPHYRRLAGIVPLGTAVQWDNYRARRFDGPVDEPGIAALFAFGRDVLRDNFMFWDVRREPRDYFADLVAGAARFPAGASGGLPAACPTVYRRCATE